MTFEKAVRAFLPMWAKGMDMTTGSPVRVVFECGRQFERQYAEIMKPLAEEAKGQDGDGI